MGGVHMADTAEQKIISTAQRFDCSLIFRKFVPCSSISSVLLWPSLIEVHNFVHVLRSDCPGIGAGHDRHVTRCTLRDHTS